ncbi:tryptophan-rich sensory protein [archaeon]|jgi:translocator protein|nr:tryptophan-rich sensory protein [archaeon]MBT4373576.1 tryptophan-rich sensory protein [archaeon]MBT4532024.1 tryptophan-rich sensory protein [archaeon]MBT7001691.1 tryptophan-rich sensory protein [archaeon]MBT7282417.1 tryptophan-rich sensory protein [archaeon]
MRVNWFLLIGLIIACNLIGSFGAIWTASDGGWYKNINKPSFNPPSWVFGPVWTLLFSLMGIALYLVWVAPSSNVRTVALVFFGSQFILNVLWSYLFFGINSPLWSLVEIFILLIFIITTGFYFYFVNRFAGYLLIPYFLWVGFASFLNWAIWSLNR